MRIIWIMLVGVVGLLTLALLFRPTALGRKPSGERLLRLQRSANYRDGKFQNTIPSNKIDPGTLWATLRQQFFGKEQRVPQGPLPIIRMTNDDFAVHSTELRAVWLGHATVLLEINGRRVLVDPVRSERASPFSWIGPERFHQVPLALNDLPYVDAVLITHDHYDHLDADTIRALGNRVGHFYVPLGVGAHLEHWGLAASRFTELDWGESAECAGLRLTATPARHYSGRSFNDANATLWCSWVVVGGKSRVFVSGDSGYYDGFKAIGREYGPFDLTVLKIGSYGSNWLDIHMDPESAVKQHLDLGGRVMLPVHWGTFNLAFHAWDEPIRRAVAAASQAGVTIVVPRPGELFSPSHPAPVLPWWNLK